MDGQKYFIPNENVGVHINDVIAEVNKKSLFVIGPLQLQNDVNHVKTAKT